MPKSVYWVVLSAERNEPVSERFTVNWMLQVEILRLEPPSCFVILPRKKWELLVESAVLLGTAEGNDMGFAVVDNQIATLGFAYGLAISIVSTIP
jgi:hypothetical protein